MVNMIDFKTATIAAVAALSGFVSASAGSISDYDSKFLPILHGINSTTFQTLTAGLHPGSPSDAKLHAPHILAATSTNIDCGGRPSFLTSSDCDYLNSIGVSGSGGGNGEVWVGSNGGQVFHMHNQGGTDMIVLVWQDSGFVSGTAPLVTYSLPSGASVDISVNNDGQHGGFSAIYGHSNTLNDAGQVLNIWGEWSTGDYATFDISREVDMYGSWLKLTGDNGSNAEWDNNFSQCCFTCRTITNSQYNSCYEEGTYRLDNRYSGNPGAGSNEPLTDGGCTGWNAVDVYFLSGRHLGTASVASTGSV